jgi:hypothetical protein
MDVQSARTHLDKTGRRYRRFADAASRHRRARLTGATSRDHVDAVAMADNFRVRLDPDHGTAMRQKRFRGVGRCNDIAPVDRDAEAQVSE